MQFSCHLHPPLLPWDMDPTCWLREKNPGFRDQVPEETSPCLLLGAQDLRPGAGKINLLVGPWELFLVTVKRRKLALFGHVTRQGSLSKTILQSYLEVGWRHGRQKKKKKMLDRQRQRVAAPAHARPAHNSLPRKTGRGSLLNRPTCPPTTHSVKTLSWTVLRIQECCTGCYKKTRLALYKSHHAMSCEQGKG